MLMLSKGADKNISNKQGLRPYALIEIMEEKDDIEDEKKEER